MSSVSSKKKIFITIAIGCIGVVFHLITGFFLTPKIINELGVDVYGFASLARNFVSYASIAMLALNSFGARYLTIAYHKNERDNFNEYYSTIYWGNLILIAFLTILSIIIVSKLDLLINIPTEITKQIKLLFFLIFIQFFVSNIASVFSLAGYIKDKLNLVQIVTTASYVVDVFALIIMFWVLKPVVWYIGLIGVIVSLFTLTGNFFISKRWLPEAQPKLKEFSFNALRSLFVNGIWSAINSLGNLLNSGLDLLISNLMLSVIGMGQIAVSQSFLTITSSITSISAKAFHPTFLKDYAMGDIKALVRDLKYSMKICAIPTNVIVAGFIVIGLSFLKLWVPTQNTSLLYYLTILAFLPSLAEGPMYPLYFINTLTLRNRIPCIVTVLGGVLNVVSMFFLLKYTDLGAYAVLIPTALVMCTINIVFNPIYLAYSLGIKKSTFFPNVLRNILSVIITIIADYGICYLLPRIMTWGNLVCQVLVIGIVSAIVQMVTLFNPNEIKSLVSKLRNRFHK